MTSLKKKMVSMPFQVPGSTHFEFGAVNPPPQPLEVLYEDPKEDVVSLLSEVTFHC